MNKQRIFRALVCFVLICALVVNISPIKAKAFVAETAMALGAIACIMAMYAGVVFNPQSQAQLVAIGDSFGGYISERAESLEDSLDVTELFDYWELATGGGDGDDFDPNKTKIKLARGLLKFIAGWIYTAVVTGAVEGSSGVSAPVGYTFYGEHCLVTAPVPTDALPYVCIRYYPSNQYNKFQVMAGPNPFYVRLYEGNPLYLYPGGSTFTNYVLSDASDTSWSRYSPDSSYVSLSSNMYIVWSNHDIVEEGNSNNVVFEGSDATNVQKETVVPKIYVGDIPSQIQNGSISAEDIELPENVDLSSVITSRDTLLDDISNSAQKFQDGTLSLDEYKNQIEYDDDLGGDETTPSTEPSEDPTEPEDVGPIGDYALDLTEFFPFCIPYDIKEFLSLLSAAPEAPVFEWDIVVKSWDWGFHVTVDLSPWNDVAALFRKLELLAFIVGLGFVTREKFLRG